MSSIAADLSASSACSNSETIGFADYRGNRQYVSVGNLRTNDRVSLFFMDYARKTRLKLFGRARIVTPQDVDIVTRLTMPEYKASVERGLVITVEAFDWNCPQHITERYTIEEVREAIVNGNQYTASAAE